MLRSLARAFARSGWSCEAAASPLPALDLLRRGAVDAIVADYQMHPFDGVEFCRRVRGGGFAGPLVIHSGYATRALRESAARAGAWAVVPKDASAQALALQLRTLCDARAGVVPASPLPPPRDYTAAAREYARAHGLSARETEVLALALAGQVRKQCAAHLGCSTGSVSSYWQRIYNKTGRRQQEDVLRDVLGFVLDHWLA